MATSQEFRGHEPGVLVATTPEFLVTASNDEGSWLVQRRISAGCQHGASGLCTLARGQQRVGGSQLLLQHLRHRDIQLDEKRRPNSCDSRP
jgi:hypothetical protein